jgi:hypothetical protein
MGVAVACWPGRAAAQATREADAPPPSVAPAAPPARVAPQAERYAVYDKNAKLRVGLLAGGIPLFVLSYALPCSGARGVWCVPFAGPIIKIKQLADREAEQYAKEAEQRTDQGTDEGPMIPPVFVYTLLAEVAAVQLASASMILVGALLPRREGRRVVQSVTLVPSLNPAAPGLVAVGTF